MKVRPQKLVISQGDCDGGRVEGRKVISLVMIKHG